MDIGALDGQTHLARVDHGPLKYLRRRVLHIDVIQHDGASLPPSSSVNRFSVPAALAMTFLPLAVDPGERDLGHVRMLREISAQVVLVDDHVQHAGRQQGPRTIRRTGSVVSGVVAPVWRRGVFPASSAGATLIMSRIMESSTA